MRITAPFLIIITFLFSSCGQSLGSEQKPNTYQSQSIPSFFKKLVANHKYGFYKRDSLRYLEFCEQNDLSKKDTSNFGKYYTLSILHQLFTSKTARNGSRGEILNIPYFWHWVTPNPRYKIYATENNKLIKDLKPSKDYGRYKSRADIDRTPFLYWIDLFTAKPQYYAAGCDTFSTFGWCSEREMACVCLMEILKFEGKIVAEGNHCWSEYWVLMKSSAGSSKYFKVTLDNTFDGFFWELASSKDKEKWKIYLGNLGDSKWYNSMGHSTSEKAKLMNGKASTEAMMMIEQAVTDYLKNKKGQ
jgi:hypothetical protein